MAMFAQKLLRAEVTGGIDLEAQVLLTGDRITIGSGVKDDLVLGARNVVEEHLTLIRIEGTREWEYFSSDRGQTDVDKGNPRTGKVRSGQGFLLGGETRIEILKTVPPEGFAEKAQTGEKTTVPLGVALPLMGLMLLGVAFVTTGLGRGSDTSGKLATAAYFTGASDLTEPLETCIASGLSTEAMALAGADPNAPDRLFRAIQSGSEGTDELRTELKREIRQIIAETHLLVNENRGLEASQTLRRLENVMPVGNGDCPILRAARFDLAILDLEGGR